MTAVGLTPGSRTLTRQQTFPPLQPYVRVRYLSTTAEMATCREALLEGNCLLLNFMMILLIKFYNICT